MGDGVGEMCRTTFKWSSTRTTRESVRHHNTQPRVSDHSLQLATAMRKLMTWGPDCVKEFTFYSPLLCVNYIRSEWHKRPLGIMGFKHRVM
ncbi:hypothetical protein CEXT_491701 [Caerostris extrusa]|uniref:Uncharacterized protein n=1 Tax=Caerostris extrusa TaxID=172846 RepID=A0AAV4PGW8_CAEEX|nr:hypothetical protein CEXT_491701 [Caerostris extrusa]